MFMNRERLVQDLNKIIRNLEKAVEVLDERANFDAALEITELAANTLKVLPGLVNDWQRMTRIIGLTNFNKLTTQTKGEWDE